MNEHRALINLAWATFVIVLLILILLLKRHGRTVETATILDRADVAHLETMDAIKGIRTQQCSHDDQVMGEHRYARDTLTWLRSQWEKFSHSSNYTDPPAKGPPKP